MKFKLGVIGHKDTILRVSDIVKEYFDEVIIFPEEFGNDEIISSAVERIAELQKKCDGLLYSRIDPYLLISAHLHHTVPVRYVDIDSRNFLISILKANIEYGVQPTHISIDGLDYATVIEAFESVGVTRDRLIVDEVQAESAQECMVNATLLSHLKNYKNGAHLCITNVTDVYRSLVEKSVPSTVITPSTESFVHEIRNLMLRYRLQSNNSKQLMIMHIKLQYKDKYRFYGEMPIREVDELSTASRLIAIFAESLDGAMYPLSRWEYVILCSQSIFQNDSDQFIEIDLMRQINQATTFDISIGIGCGKTIKTAESNAIIASNRTLSHRGTNSFVALSEEQIIGPISPKSEHYIDQSKTDFHLSEVAKATGLSSHVLNELYEITKKQDSNLITSAIIAQHLEVSSRTANRIIERLLDNNYASIEGKDLSQTRGRPSRIIRLLI